MADHLPTVHKSLDSLFNTTKEREQEHKRITHGRAGEAGGDGDRRMKLGVECIKIHHLEKNYILREMKLGQIHKRRTSPYITIRLLTFPVLGK